MPEDRVTMDKAALLELVGTLVRRSLRCEVCIQPSEPAPGRIVQLAPGETAVGIVGCTITIACIEDEPAVGLA